MPRRAKLVREAQLAELEKLHNRGWSQHDLARHFNLHHSTIQDDLAEIARRYNAITMLERGAEVQRKIAALRDVRKEAWLAWERSKENKERQIKEKISESLDGEGKPTVDTLQRMKVVITTEGQLPGSEYLAIILRTFEQEYDLLNLIIKRFEHSGAAGAPVVLQVAIKEVSRDEPGNRPAPDAN